MIECRRMHVQEAYVHASQHSATDTLSSPLYPPPPDWSYPTITPLSHCAGASPERAEGLFVFGGLLARVAPSTTTRVRKIRFISESFPYFFNGVIKKYVLCLGLRRCTVLGQPLRRAYCPLREWCKLCKMQFCFIKKVTWIAVTNVASECALRKKGVELLGAVGVLVGCGIC